MTNLSELVLGTQSEMLVEMPYSPPQAESEQAFTLSGNERQDLANPDLDCVFQPEKMDTSSLGYVSASQWLPPTPPNHLELSNLLFPSATTDDKSRESSKIVVESRSAPEAMMQNEEGRRLRGSGISNGKLDCNRKILTPVRRRVVSENTASPPASWISGHSALLTVLTRDLYPPTSEWILPPPENIDLQQHYADFLPKNLSDTTCEDHCSNIPKILGRSASTESLHKDRLLPLLDKFFDSAETPISFSTKKIYNYTQEFGSPHDSSFASSRPSDVGFYLDPSSPTYKSCCDLISSSAESLKFFYPSSEKSCSSSVSPVLVPYLDDNKEIVTRMGFSTPETSSASLRSRSVSSYQKLPRRDSSVRSQSAEPTKKDKRSEKARKFLRVRFADTEGHDLTFPKVFARSDEVHIPKRALEVLRPGIEKDSPDIGARYFYPQNFNIELRTEQEKMLLIQERKVILQNVNITSDLILGMVHVINISSSHKKKVFIRCTFNDWNSFVDIPAGHVSSDSDGVFEQFNFALGIPRHFVQGDLIEFAVGYTGMGRIYWDNHDGKNYVIECFARQCPLHDADRSWISFL